MSLNGSDRDRLGASLLPAALAELDPYLALRSYLPRRGGLFGSGFRQFMAARAASPAPAAFNPIQAVQPPPSALGAIGTRGPDANYQLAALSSPSGWPIPVPGCARSHGQPPVAPPPAPPRPPVADDPWTYDPDISRRNGGGWGTSPSGDDHKQCEIQLRNDGRICGRQPDDETKAICRASATKRYAHCLRTDEVGNPALDTRKRLQGEPPIRRWKKPR